MFENISDENVQFEKDKAKIIVEDTKSKCFIHKLEDSEYLKGSIHNFLIKDKLKCYSKLIDKIWNHDNVNNISSNSKIIRSLLTIEYREDSNALSDDYASEIESKEIEKSAQLLKEYEQQKKRF